MKKVLMCISAILGLLAIMLACGRDRTTTVYGKVIDTSNQPVANVPILIAGNKGFLSRGEDLQTIVTDKQGIFSVTLKPDKKFTSLDVANQFFKIPTLYIKYKNFIVLTNNEKSSVCCPAEIGFTSEFSYTLTP